MAQQIRLKADQIEGLREFVSRVLLEESEKLFPPTLIEDIERIRRSPAGAIIRMEEKVDRLEKGFAKLATKEELARIAEMMATKEDIVTINARMSSIEERMATKEDIVTINARVSSIEERMATKEELGALTERVSSIEERMATKEDLATMNARMATKEELAKIAEIMATKEELRALTTRIGEIEERMVTKAEFASLERAMNITFTGMERRFSFLQRVFLATFALIIGLQTAILVRLFIP